MRYLEKNTIMKIDAIEGMNLIEPNSVDLIFADLPYGCTSNPYDIIIPFDEMWKAIDRIRKPNSAICLFGQGKFYLQLCNSNIDEWRYDYCWNKILKSGFLSSGFRPLSQKEMIGVFYKKTPTYNPQFTVGKPLHSVGKNASAKRIVNNNYDDFKMVDNSRFKSTQKFPSDIFTTEFDIDDIRPEVLDFQKVHPSKAIHHTEKSAELCDFIVKTYTNKGDTVLDFCCGSGSIPLSAVRNERFYYGFDIGKCLNKNNEYFNMDWSDVTQMRIDEYSQSPKQMTFVTEPKNIFKSEEGEQLKLCA